MTDDGVVGRWKKEVVAMADDIDPSQDLDWYCLWIGFVIGCGRSDLIDEQHYMRLGFPEERGE